MNIWTLLTKRHCENDLDAYLDQSLPPRKRQRVARHLDACPACYRAYRQKRDLRAELQRALPLVGQRHEPDFAALWGNIQREIPQPQPVLPPGRMRLGLAALMVMMMLMLPFIAGQHEAALAQLPTYPRPLVVATESPESTEPVTEASLMASLTRESQFVSVTSVPTLPEPDVQEPVRGFDGNHN